MESPETQPAIEEAVVTGLPTDANDMRGYHFSRLMRTPLTLILVAALTAIAFAAGLIFIGAAIGAGGALVALLLGIRPGETFLGMSVGTAKNVTIIIVGALMITYVIVGGMRGTT